MVGKLKNKKIEKKELKNNKRKIMSKLNIEYILNKKDIVKFLEHKKEYNKESESEEDQEDD